jgi:hypothetical protein
MKPIRSNSAIIYFSPAKALASSKDHQHLSPIESIKIIVFQTDSDWGVR